MDYAANSREALAETLLAAGPTEATLCEGWETRHLAAHLVLREHSVWAAGLIGGPLQRGMERRLEDIAAKAEDPGVYSLLVAKFGAGPGKVNPMRLHRVDQAANLLEYFVHTEDARRARDRWAPRALEAGYDQALWNQLLQRAGLLYRGAGVGVILVRSDGQRRRVRPGADAVALYGDIGELIMHAHGRTDHALVTFEGAPDAVRRFAEYTAKV